MRRGAPPRVLHVVGLKGVGGVECLFSDYIASPRRCDLHESVLVTKSIHPFFAATVRRGARTVYRQKYLGPLKLPRYGAALGRLNVGRIFADARPELVISWGAVPQESWVEECRRIGAPLLYYDHGMSWHVRERHELEALRGVDGLVAVSHAAKRMMELRIGFRGPGVVLPNGLRSGALAAAPVPVRRDGLLRVGYAGRLHPMKGVPLVLHAVARLAGQGRAVELHIAGRGEEERALKALAARLGIARQTRFHGLLQEMSRFYSGIDVLVCPSLREPFGLVAIEGAAHGCPVLLARVDGLPETVIEGVTGFGFDTELTLEEYVELGGSAADLPELVYDPAGDRLRRPRAVDPACIAAALARFQDDPDLRRRMGRAGREHAVGSFGFADYVARLQGVVAAYLAGAAPRSAV